LGAPLGDASGGTAMGEPPCGTTLGALIWDTPLVAH
jgi:hypothetical protein